MRRVRKVVLESCDKCGKDYHPNDMSDDGLCRWCNLRTFIEKYAAFRKRHFQKPNVSI